MPLGGLFLKGRRQNMKNLASREQITEASHRLCAALHSEGIDPAAIEIRLPQDAWWRLWARLEQTYPGIMKFDGRGAMPMQFQFMGIVFRPIDVAKATLPSTPK